MAKNESGGSNSMFIDMQKALKGIDYPANKQTLSTRLAATARARKSPTRSMRYRIRTSKVRRRCRKR